MQIIGVNEIPIINAGWLIPVVQDSEGNCFTCGCRSIHTHSYADFEESVRNAQLVGFTKPSSIPLEFQKYASEDHLNDYNKDILNTEIATVFVKSKIIEELQNNGFSILNYLFSLTKFIGTSLSSKESFRDYMFINLFGKDIKTFTKWFFSCYSFQIVSDIKSNKKPIKDLCNDCACLMDFVHNKISAKYAIALYHILMLKENVKKDIVYNYSYQISKIHGIKDEDWECLASNEDVLFQEIMKYV